jgi:hypothetical protein
VNLEPILQFSVQTQVLIVKHVHLVLMSQFWVQQFVKNAQMEPILQSLEQMLFLLVSVVLLEHTLVCWVQILLIYASNVLEDHFQQ